MPLLLAGAGLGLGVGESCWWWWGPSTGSGRTESGSARAVGLVGLSGLLALRERRCGWWEWGALMGAEGGPFDRLRANGFGERACGGVGGFVGVAGFAGTTGAGG